MEILNRAVLEDLEAGRPLRLDLGSGAQKQPGYYGVDRVAAAGVDMVADLNEPLDLLPDESVIEVVSRHTLEHIRNLEGLLGELHRLVRSDGKITITVPHFSNPYAYSDPTHVRTFGLFTMYYFCDPADQPRRKVPSHYTELRFTVEEVFLRFATKGLWGATAGRLFQWLVNRGFAAQHGYERRWAWWWPADEIRYVIRPKKEADR